MRIGIFGGTFNPPHRGHVTIARAAVEQLSLDKLLVIPAGIPPHKQLPEGSASNEQRYEMAVLLAGAVGKCAVADDRELRREGKSYTADTLLQLREEYPEDELWLLMGSDMFLSLHTWCRPEVVCRGPTSPHSAAARPTSAPHSRRRRPIWSSFTAPVSPSWITPM